MSRLLRALPGLLLALPAYAADLAAGEAWYKALEGELLIVDIRQPEEWRATGVVPGALRLSMQHPEGGRGFVRDLLEATGGRRDLPIALICRTGNRSAVVRDALREIGFSRVEHIPEGMVGSSAGPGWLLSGLPVEACTAC